MKEETLPAVSLFQNNLDDLINLFKEHALDITFPDSQYFYDDLAEMREKTEPRPPQSRAATFKRLYRTRAEHPA